MNNTTMVVIVLVAALALLGIVAVIIVPMQQVAEGLRGCINAGSLKALNTALPASDGRCFLIPNGLG
jgi:hypothetical protein